MYEKTVMLQASNNRYGFKQAAHAAGPKWTMAELAESFGLSTQQLLGARRMFPGFPEPAISCSGSSVANKRVYYDKRAAGAWYKVNETAIKQHFFKEAS